MIKLKRSVKVLDPRPDWGETLSRQLFLSKLGGGYACVLGKDVPIT